MKEMTDFIKQKAIELESDTINMRTHLHEHPELSSKEFETVKYLKKKIIALGLKIEDVPNSTGFVALLDTGKPGKTLGIRADIDALPIDEDPNNLAGPRKYISKNPGVMHACGHDGHMAIALSTMEILQAMKDKLSGKVHFIFEEGEEIGAGIDAMVAYLEDKQIDAIYGNHLAAFMDSGTISIDAGPKMAGAIFVDFSIYGKSGHGARPDLSVNPLFGAAHVLTGLTNAWANQVDVTKTVTLGLTQIHGGHANNVIPERVDIGGSLRFYDVEEGKRAIDIVKKVADLTAQAHNCTVEFSEDFKVVAHPVINDDQLADIAIRANEEIKPGSVVHDVQWFASEPFNEYAKVAPTLFAFVGTRSEEAGSGAEHHNKQFELDEDALIYGVQATAKFAVDYLQA